MDRYDCPYLSDGVQYSVVIWATSEAEAAEKMRALPWQAGNGPSGRPHRESRETLRSAAVLALLVASMVMSAMMVHHGRAELKQVADLLHLKPMSHPAKTDKVHVPA
jgi:hypothetical protein